MGQKLQECVSGERVYSIKPVKSVIITSKDNAGLVKSVSVKTKNQEYNLSYKQFAHIAPKVKSRFYTITKRGKQFIIKGKGFGHHMGLCQWGARKKVEKGCGWREILDFYYPGTVLMKILPKAKESGE